MRADNPDNRRESSKSLRVDTVERLYRSARELEHLDQRIRIALISTDLIDALKDERGNGRWSELVRFRFVEDERHPGVVEVHLRDVDDRALLDVLRERGIVSFEEEADS